MAWEMLGIPMVAGVDTATDPKVLVPPKLSVLENGVFTTRGSIRKRFGYSALPMKYTNAAGAQVTLYTAGGLYALMTRERELLALDSNSIYTRDTGHNAAFRNWQRQGALDAIAVSYSRPPFHASSGGGSQTLMGDRASSSAGAAIYAWEDPITGAPGTINYAITDPYAAFGANGTLTPTYIKSTILIAERPKCLSVGGYLWLYYYDVGSFSILAMRFDPGTGAIAIYTLAADVDTVTPIYDVELVDGGLSSRLAYLSNAGTPTIKYAEVSVAGVLSSAFSWVVTDPVSSLAVAGYDSGYALMATTTAGAYVRAIIRSGGSTVTSGTLDATAGRTYRNITGVFTAPTGVFGELETKLNVFWEQIGPTTRTNVVRYGALTTSGVVTAATAFRRRSGLASRAWKMGATAWPQRKYAYVMLTHNSPLQATYFIARTDPEWADTVGQFEPMIVGCVMRGTAGGLTTKASHLPQVQSLGGSRFQFLGLQKTRLDAFTNATTVNAVYTQRQLADVVMDFSIGGSQTQQHRNAQYGKALYVSGAQLWQYDGSHPAEAGFHLYPELDAGAGVASNAAGALTSSVSYSYRVYYEWTNAQAEREQSSFAGALTIALGAGDNTVTLTIPSLVHTNKTFYRAGTCSIVVYRTAANPTTESPYYRVSSVDPTVSGANGYVGNSHVTDSATFIDKMADVDLVRREIDYQSGGELDNLPAPSCTIMTSGKDRLFVAGVEDPNEIWASKLRVSGECAAFNEALTIRLPGEGGPITALAILGDSLLAFKADRVYAIGGDGPDNTGQGSFTSAQLVTADAGCIDQRTLVAAPPGIMFQSRKGFRLLDQQFQLEDVGADVTSYNTATFTAATILPATNQIRFLAAGKSMLVYDYSVGQWSVFKTALSGWGFAAALWASAADASPAYYYTDGITVYGEDSTLFTDVFLPYSLVVQTGWIPPFGSQGYGRVRRIYVLGDRMSDHTAKLTACYSFKASPAYELIWFPLVGGVYQYCAASPVQKCEAIRLRIEDVSPIGSGEGFDLQQIGLECAPKGGGMRLPELQRI